MIYNITIPQKIKQLRMDCGYSQQKIADFLSVDRVVYGNIEKWSRELKVVELAKLAEMFGVSVEYFFGDSLDLPQKKSSQVIQDIRISVPSLNIDKFKEVILYICENLSWKSNFSDTVLHKILYFCDFDYYEIYEEFFIWSKYIKNHFWPTSIEMRKILDLMLKEKEIIQDEKNFGWDKNGRVYKSTRKPNLTKINWAEKEILDKVISRLWDMNATKISDYVHWDVPWISTQDWESIDYESVFYRTPQYSVRNYDEE